MGTFEARIHYMITNNVTRIMLLFSRKNRVNQAEHIFHLYEIFENVIIHMMNVTVTVILKIQLPHQRCVRTISRTTFKNPVRNLLSSQNYTNFSQLVLIDIQISRYFSPHIYWIAFGLGLSVLTEENNFSRQSCVPPARQKIFKPLLCK